MEQPNKSKMKILILEDDCERIKVFSSNFIESNMTVTNCAETAILFLNSYKFDIVFLDHDLGGEVYVDSNDKNTGSEVCKQINELNKGSLVVIHSWNATGAKNMKRTLDGKGFNRVFEHMFNESLVLDVKGQMTK